MTSDPSESIAPLRGLYSRIIHNRSRNRYREARGMRRWNASSPPLCKNKYGSFHRPTDKPIGQRAKPRLSYFLQKKQETTDWLSLVFMRKTGLEPVRCKPHAPQTCASASSATSAYLGLLRKDFPIRNFLEGFSCLWAVAHNVMYYTTFFPICQ